MSSASDISAFEHSVEPAPAETLFRDKKWTYNQNITSNTGQYTGQIQFNLLTISSQAAFVNREEAVIELPVKLQILNGGAGSVSSTAVCTIDQLAPKAGEWQLIDSVQAAIDGTTVQTNHFYDNVNTTFKAITETDYNTANLQAVSKSQVYVAPASAVTAGSPFYVAHYLACIKLQDICDYFKKCPMQKNPRGFIYLNYNSSSTTLVTPGSAVAVAPATTASLSNNMNFGCTCPVLWNIVVEQQQLVVQAAALHFLASAVSLTSTADANGTPTAGARITPSQSLSRLLVPNYSPNPSADHALAQKKTFRHFERITNKLTVAPGDGIL
ncbi:hypothetical protein GN244_ATG18242 [Phytophthora infestans]|uniref:Uncharacterized protein n=1 Tax=Phytophthora infestans TaxID=4787 RepID=A0A833RPT1_PHYIN|nr:hypothetical protein GN244_ATG18242 [Phytophthora infestans]